MGRKQVVIPQISHERLSRLSETIGITMSLILAILIDTTDPMDIGRRFQERIESQVSAVSNIEEDGKEGDW